MNTETRQTIHLGINFLISPVPLLDLNSKLRFQQSLATSGIEFSHVELEREIVVIREASPRLEIKIAALPGAPLAQLLIVSPDQRCELGLFTKDVEAIIQAFEATWTISNRQTISSDVAIRDLYESSSEHAFRELWEGRLKQPSDSLARLGRPVLGGGLRFVMPPLADEPNPHQIEVKIESFLRDSKKVFVETQFTWTVPTQPSAPWDAKERLAQVDRYVEDQVETFIVGGQ
jgi:hypothetical protein